MYERIKSLVKARGTTIESVAKAAGMTRGAYNTAKRRGLALRSDVLYVIARELGVPMEYFITGHSLSPPQKIKELLGIAEKLDDSEIEMLLSIAETYLQKKKPSNELGAEPRTKVG
jgi:transcriptional regulator with XRE-family HTH domain